MATDWTRRPQWPLANERSITLATMPIQWSNDFFTSIHADGLLGGFPLAADGRHDGTLFLQLGESLVNLFAVALMSLSLLLPILAFLHAWPVKLVLL